MLVKLVLGDWSADGHGQTEVRIYECDLTVDEIDIAYRVGTQLVGFDFTNEVATDYQEASIELEHLERLLELGILNDEMYNDVITNKYNDKYYIDSDLYFNVYWAIVAIHQPEMFHKEVKIPEIDIGGYGFFE